MRTPYIQPADVVELHTGADHDPYWVRATVVAVEEVNPGPQGRTTAIVCTDDGRRFERAPST